MATTTMIWSLGYLNVYHDFYEKEGLGMKKVK